MAFPHPQGLTPNEVAFLCEMEQITIIPRQRLESLDLLGGPTTALIPPQRTTLPLWLALLLKRQKRANILPPPWLHPSSLRDILELETIHYQDTIPPPPRFDSSTTGTTTRERQLTAQTRTDITGTQFYTSPPFIGSMISTSQSNALPYHWFELASMLLDGGASDDLVEPDVVRGLLRDLREVRLAKMRRGFEELHGEGEGVQLDGVGAMEIAESRGFILGVVDALRTVGASKEVARREREEEERERAGRGRFAGRDGVEDEDEDMT